MPEYSLGDVDGLVLVGRFKGVTKLGDDGAMRSIQVECRRWDGQTYTRGALFFVADRDTGERTLIDQEAAVLSSGDMIAVTVKAEVGKASGNPYMKALKVALLKEVAPSLVPNGANPFRPVKV